MPSVVGSIGHLTITRSDLNFTRGVLSTVAVPSLACPDAPTLAHRRCLARALHYLRATTELGLLFRAAYGLDLHAYVDANFAQEFHRAANGVAGSRSLFVILAAGACITSGAPRQGPTAQSTAEAVIYALSLCIRALLGVRRLAALVLSARLPPSVIFEDNTAVIAMLR